MRLWLAPVPCAAAFIAILWAAAAVAQLPAAPVWKPGALQQGGKGVAPASPPVPRNEDAAMAAGPVPIVYSRCARTRGEVEIRGFVEKGGVRRPARRILRHPDIYDILPDVTHAMSDFNAPCDLVFRDAQGSEKILFDCESRTTEKRSCAALDAAVSFDGRTVAFSVFSGALNRPRHYFWAQLLDPDAENRRERFDVRMPNRHLNAREARLYLADIATGRVSPLPHRPGDFDAGPAWLSNGRIAFTSTRSGQYSTLVPGATGQQPATQIFTMDLDGRNVDKASYHALAGDLHPLQLRDGRVALSSWQIFGLLPFRDTNGSRGGFGTLRNFFHIYGQNPDGGNQFAIFGQHTGNRTSPGHKAAHFIGQSANGWLLVADYYRGNNLGLGTIFQFPIPPDGQEGIGPDDNPDIGNIYRPRRFSALTPWASNGDHFSAVMPPPGYRAATYRDPMAYVGKVSHPSGLPGNQVLLTYGLGPCSTVGGAAALPKPWPPLVSGSGSLVPMNSMTHLGLDNPGCDTGIYRTTRNPSRHPSDLRVVVNRRDYHEVLARPALPYRTVYGIDAPPVIPRSDVASADDSRLPEGTPFGLLGAASITFRETRPIGGIPFEGESQWGLQGTDAVDYTDDELCGVRILAVHPNAAREYRRLHSATGERVSILGEFPVRKGPDDPDTSFLVRFPSNTPYLMQGVDCLGRTLNTDQTWQHLRPGERKVCGGCHVHGKPGLPFERSAAARPEFQPFRLGEGKVPLLRGGPGHRVRVEERPGYGLTVEFMRDVLPIFRKRCVQCHGGSQAKAGLRLDIPGVDEKSTWWRLVRDRGQKFVPPRLRHNSGARFRKPQLTRYLRFMNSRGSLLYWKAANRRLDGRTDAQYGPQSLRGWNDVDFGADHPSAITEDELALLSRWIDTGSAAGPGYDIDLIPPVLNVAGLVMNDIVTVLQIGTADVSSGVDRSSLEVCVSRGEDACDETYRPDAAAAGIVSLPVWLSRHDVNREIRIRVSDRAGNRTELRRTVGWLLRQEKARTKTAAEKAVRRD